MVVNTSPASGATGIAIGSEILVFFEEEMDLSSINSGTFVLLSPDNASVFNSDLSSVEEVVSSNQNPLVSALPLDRVVPGTYRFLQADTDNNILETELEDTSGDGSLWRTVAVFTPSVPLLPNIEYDVIISGDESADGFSSGVKTRSVYDPVVTKTGTGSLAFFGSYTGEVAKTYSLEMQTGGTTGTATYIWWDNSSPLTTFSGITTTGKRKLEKGLYVSFDADGSFISGDKWEVLCLPSSSIGETSSWSFTTGDGNIVIPPSDYSTSGIEFVSPGALSGRMSVLSVSPSAGKYGVAISTDPYVGNEISILFDSAPDETSFIDAITVISESVIEGGTATGELEVNALLSGNSLILQLLPGQLYTNNIVGVTLDSNILNTDGLPLGEDYVSYFSTPYSPLYTSYRRILLDLGSSLDNISEEIVYYAILEASREVDAFSFAPIANSNYYQYAKRQYTTCLAELILIRGLLNQSSGGKFSKRLGDFSISRDGDSSLKDLKGDLQECLSLWRATIESGGAVTPDTSIGAEIAVKGMFADDAISVTRQWSPISKSNYFPAANTSVQNPTGNTRRRLRSYRRRS